MDRVGRGRRVLARPSVRGALFVLAAVATIATTVPASATSSTRISTHDRTVTRTATSTATRPASPSVMIQLSTLTQTGAAADLTSWLRHICPSGVVPNGRLVLQDVAGADGRLLTTTLDAIVPFLPGASSHPCFSRVFVGTLEPAWTGTGNAYVEGVQDAAFVTDYVTRSAAVARAFVARYPQVTADWYLTYEANLNELYYSQVSAGYLNLLAGQMQSLATVRRNRQFMWSPAFWYPYSSYSQNTLGMAGLKTSLTSLFTALKANGHGIDVLDLQDYVAGSSCQPVGNRMTASDAVGWVNFLRGLGVISDVSVNTEQYAVDCATGGIVDGNSTEVQNREAYYQSRGMTLGPAFELRYWIKNHA